MGNARSRLSTLAACTWLAAFSVPVWAQSPETPPASVTARRPGRFRLGPFYLTPTFHIGTIGLDTNVFYTATDHQTDISASGGPGLGLVLPLGASGRFFANGNLDYLYFVKTESQRRLRGDANTGLDFKGSRTVFHLEESYAETFGRPSYEVDERIAQTEEATSLDLKRRLFGRIAIRLFGRRSRQETAEGSDYLGNDLTTTLTQDVYRALGGLDYAISVKTSFVVEAQQDWNRFPLDHSRDLDTLRIWTGFRTDSTALLAGQALVGVAWFGPPGTPDLKERRTIADVTVTWKASPKTSVIGHYTRDLATSAFDVSGPTPTVFNERYGLRFEKDLVGNLNVRVYGTITAFVTNGAITIDLPEQGPVTAVRDDRVREAGIDVGYRFRPRFRVGVVATYTERQSNFDYFGIEGLLIGASVQYTP
jgi:hypothetical protein